MLVSLWLETYETHQDAIRELNETTGKRYNAGRIYVWRKGGRPVPPAVINLMMRRLDDVGYRLLDPSEKVHGLAALSVPAGSASD